MKRVTGIGGVFLKARDPKALNAWYARHLGIPIGEHGADFRWRDHGDPDIEGTTVWSLFPQESKYFDPSTARVMINYRVEDLDALLDILRKEGITVFPKQEEEYGKFAWIMDPEGNKIELWEPPQKEPAKK